jgi:hypothetical protein
MRLDADQERKDLELTKSQGIAAKCEACGSEGFAISDMAEPIGGGSEGYTAKVIYEECGTPARAFEVQESDL